MTAMQTLDTAAKDTPQQPREIKGLPFSEHLNKLPAPVKDFIARRPGTAVGIAALAGLALLVVKRRPA